MADRVCAHPDCLRPFQVQASKVAAGRGLYCSRRCLSSMIARRNHEKYPQLGERNPNFKGWRSRDKRAYVNRFRERYPEKALAHDVVEWALRSGRLVRPATCQRCGQQPTESLHAHHDDYTRPLMVRFLCRPCHRIVDAERRAELNEKAS